MEFLIWKTCLDLESGNKQIMSYPSLTRPYLFFVVNFSLLPPNLAFFSGILFFLRQKFRPVLGCLALSLWMVLEGQGDRSGIKFEFWEMERADWSRARLLRAMNECGLSFRVSWRRGHWSAQNTETPPTLNRASCQLFFSKNKNTDFPLTLSVLIRMLNLFSFAVFYLLNKLFENVDLWRKFVPIEYWYRVPQKLWTTRFLRSFKVFLHSFKVYSNRSKFFQKLNFRHFFRSKFFDCKPYWLGFEVLWQDKAESTLMSRS